MANDSNEYARKDRQLDVRKGAHTESEGDETSVSRRNYLKLAGAATAAAVATAGIGSASTAEQQYGEGGYGENAFGGNATDGGGPTDGDSTDNNTSADPVVEQFEIAERNRRNPHAEFVIDWGVSDPNEALKWVIITVTTTDGKTVDTKMINVTGASASGSDKIRRKHGDGESYDVSLVVTNEYDNVSSRETTINV